MLVKEDGGREETIGRSGGRQAGERAGRMRNGWNIGGNGGGGEGRAEGGKDEVVVGVGHELGRETGCEDAVLVVMAMWRRWRRWVVGAGRGRRRRKGGGSPHRRGRAAPRFAASDVCPTLIMCIVAVSPNIASDSFEAARAHGLHETVSERPRR